MHGWKKGEVIVKMFSINYDTSIIDRHCTGINNQYHYTSMDDYWIWARVNEETNIKMQITCKYFITYRIQYVTLFSSFRYLWFYLQKHKYGVMLPTGYYFMKNLTRIHFPDYVNLLYRLIYCWEKNHDSMSLQRFSLQAVPGLCYIIMLLKGQFEIICWVYTWHISGINFILKVPQYESRLVLLLFLSHTSFDKYHI